MRTVFFSFHYQQDIHRVRYIRSPQFYARNYELAGFWDGSIEETHPTFDRHQIKQLINGTLYGTSVTVVLIGKYTSDSRWVRYEIKQSYRRNNGLIGIYIHKLRNKHDQIDSKGENPFEYIKDVDGELLSYSVQTYDWFDDEAKHNIGNWIEEAAQEVGR